MLGASVCSLTSQICTLNIFLETLAGYTMGKGPGPVVAWTIEPWLRARVVTCQVLRMHQDALDHTFKFKYNLLKDILLLGLERTLRWSIDDFSLTSEPRPVDWAIECFFVIVPRHNTLEMAYSQPGSLRGGEATYGHTAVILCT